MQVMPNKSREFLKSSRLLAHRLSVIGFCTRPLSPKYAELPAEVLPSEEFIKGLRQPQLGKLARFVAEMEFLYSISQEVPSHLTDEHWKNILSSLLDPDPIPREIYLRKLFHAEFYNDEKAKKGSAEQLEVHRQEYAKKFKEFENGAMAYGKTFYSMFGDDFYGGKIDAVYGSKFYQSERLAEPLPKLIIDCRYLPVMHWRSVSFAVNLIQKIHDYNWISKWPFEVTIANFSVANKDISRAIHKHWHFMFGPNPNATSRDTFVNTMINSVDEDEIFELEEEIGSGSSKKSQFKPNPFCPKISTWDITRECGENIRKEEIAYISPKANKYLDDSISHFKAFVISSFDDLENPRPQSISAAIEDQLPAYRLPIKKYIKFSGWSKPKSLSSATVANILRDVYHQQLSWEAAFRKWLPINDASESNFQRCATDYEYNPSYERKKRFKLLRDFSNELSATCATEAVEKVQKPIYEKRNFDHTKNRWYADMHRNNNDVPRKRCHVHRYSREERNRRRAEEAAKQQQQQNSDENKNE